MGYFKIKQERLTRCRTTLNKYEKTVKTFAIMIFSQPFYVAYTILLTNSTISKKN